jgi:hypothetical protein
MIEYNNNNNNNNNNNSDLLSKIHYIKYVKNGSSKDAEKGIAH